MRDRFFDGLTVVCAIGFVLVAIAITEPRWLPRRHNSYSR